MARMFADIYEPDGTPYKGDPRWALKRNLKKAADLGYTFYVGPELEYFYFKSSRENPRSSTREAISISPPWIRNRASARNHPDPGGHGDPRGIQPS